MRSYLQESAFKYNGFVQTGHGPPSLCSQPNFSNTASWVFPSPASYSKLGGLLTKFKPHFDRIRNWRCNKQRSLSPPALTHSRNVHVRVGNYGNVIAMSLSVCSTSRPAGLGLGQDRDQAEQIKLKGGCFRQGYWAHWGPCQLCWSLSR